MSDKSIPSLSKTISTPLFWDLHLHGVAGVDFMHADEDEAVHAAQMLGSRGIGFFAPTLLTAKAALLHDACRRWGAIFEKISRHRRWLPKTAALPLGLHLEGPFLNPQMAGAHPVSHLHRPNIAYARRLIAAAQGHVAIMTMAPELPGALGVIRALSKKGVRIQLGHTMATAAQAVAATRAGAAGITHLYNAMKIHHRSPGVLALMNDGKHDPRTHSAGPFTAELITDGLHLDPAIVAWTIAAAGSHCYAVSDGCSATAAPRYAPLTLGSLVLKKKGATALVAATGTLAGGATFLSEHPHRLCRYLPKFSKREMNLFHKLQAAFFARQATQGPQGRNYFSAQTMAYLGTHFRR